MTTPLIKWPGGKRWLASKIAPYLKGTFVRYFEPFLGGAAFLFALEPSKGIASDINSELISCYKAVRENAQRVLMELNKLRSSKSEYYRIRDKYNPQCKFKRAAIFIYLLRHSWNGLYRVNRDGHFNVPYCTRARKDKLTQETMINTQSILKRLIIKCGDFEKIISEAKEGDFIFADPPYFGNDHNKFGRYNAISFDEVDQKRVAKALFEAEHNGAAWVLTNGCLEKVLIHFHGYDIFILPRYSSIAANPKARGMIHEYIVLSKSNSLDKLRHFLDKNYQRLIK